VGGDVGQDQVEEVNMLSAKDQNGKGANLGWDLYEGNETFDSPDPAGAASEGPFVEPVFTYQHEPGCSVTGGTVYRGGDIPDLDGYYLYGDLCQAGVRAIKVSSGRVADERNLDDQVTSVVSFGEDESGELYVVSLDQGVFALAEQ
jgi:hypothetical protein